MKRKLPEKFFEQNQRAKTRKWKFFNLSQALWGAGNREFRYFATHLQNDYTAPFVTVQNITELAFLVTILVTTDSSIRSGWALFPTLFLSLIWPCQNKSLRCLLCSFDNWRVRAFTPSEAPKDFISAFEATQKTLSSAIRIHLVLDTPSPLGFDDQCHYPRPEQKLMKSTVSFLKAWILLLTKKLFAAESMVHAPKPPTLKSSDRSQRSRILGLTTALRISIGKTTRKSPTPPPTFWLVTCYLNLGTLT